MQTAGDNSQLLGMGYYLEHVAEECETAWNEIEGGAPSVDVLRRRFFISGLPGVQILRFLELKYSSLYCARVDSLVC